MIIMTMMMIMWCSGKDLMMMFAVMMLLWCIEGERETGGEGLMMVM